MIAWIRSSSFVVVKLFASTIRIGMPLGFKNRSICWLGYLKPVTNTSGCRSHFGHLIINDDDGSKIFDISSIP